MSSEDSRDYDVGYGKPPKHTQFQPGRSGNPRGRPKKTNDPEELIERELDRRIRIKENGTWREMRVRELFFRSLVQAGVKGQVHAQKVLLAYLLERRDPGQFTTDAVDEQALRDFIKRLDRTET